MNLVQIAEKPWFLVASASNFAYSSLEILYLDYQVACFKLGLLPELHVRLFRVNSDEFELCISMKLGQLVDKNMEVFTHLPCPLYYPDAVQLILT